MKIQKITIKGFRNVPDQELIVDGHNIILYGDNRVGKSNFIRAIHSLVNAEFGNNNIAHDQDKATIEAVLSEFSDWTPIEGSEHLFRAVIKRKKNSTEEAKPTIELHYPDGGIENRVTDIRSFIGTVPLQFHFVELSKTKPGKKQQVDIVVSMYDETFQEELRKQKNRALSAYNERTEVGQQLKAVKGFIEEAGISHDDISKYANFVDTIKLREQRDLITKENARIEEVKLRSANREEEIKKIDLECVEIGKEIDRLKAKLKEKMVSIDSLNEQNVQAGKWLNDPANAPKEIALIEKQLSEAELHNQKNARVTMLSKKIAERDEIEKQYGELTAKVDSIKGAIDVMIRETKPPIPGVTWDDEQIFYNGKPVDEDNMSTAEIMMLEIMLQMCKAKQGQILFIERGESLGTELLKELYDLSIGSGFQMIREQVERDTKELRVVIESE